MARRPQKLIDSFKSSSGETSVTLNLKIKRREKEKLEEVVRRINELEEPIEPVKLVGFVRKALHRLYVELESGKAYDEL